MKKINWNKIKDIYQVGSLVKGKVTEHYPFGIFVDIGSKSVVGLVKITNFIDEEDFSPKNFSPEDYPAIGTNINAIVIAYGGDTSNEIVLSMKPSILSSVRLSL